MAWQVQDAKQRFSELLRSAHADGPQIITRHGNDAVVVVDAVEWARKVKRTGNLTEFFAASPLRGSGIKLSWRKERPRKVDL